MTGSDHPTPSAPPELAGLPLATGAERVRTARRWAVGVLVGATLALGAYLAVVLVAVWLVGSVIDEVTSRDSGTVDITGYVAAAVPGVLAGWCVGLAAAGVLARGDALGARAAGLASGASGALVGATILAVTGVL